MVDPSAHAKPGVEMHRTVGIAACLCACLLLVSSDSVEARKVFRPPFTSGCLHAEDGVGGLAQGSADCNPNAGSLATYATAMFGASAAEAVQEVWFAVDSPQSLTVTAELLKGGGKADAGISQWSGTYAVLEINGSRKLDDLDAWIDPWIVLDKALAIIGLIGTGTGGTGTAWEIVDAIGLLNDFRNYMATLEQLERSGDIDRITITDSYQTTSNEIVTIHAGLRAQATGALFGTGTAFAFGQLVQVTVDGCDPPPMPTVIMADSVYVGQNVWITVSTPGNGERVYYAIDWGDGSPLTVTSDAEGDLAVERWHIYQDPGLYTVTVRGFELDQTESEEQILGVRVYEIPGSTFPGDVFAEQGESCTDVLVEWEEVPSALSYSVWIDHPVHRKLSEDIPNPCASPVYCGWVDNPPPGERRHYYVLAELPGGFVQVSESSAWGFTFTPPAVPDSIVTDLNCRVDLWWPWDPQATRYELWRSDTPDSLTATLITDAFDGHDDPPLAYQPYYYWLRAANDCGTSGFSPMVITQKIGIPPPVPNPTASTTLCDRVRLDWDPTGWPGMVEYRVYRDEGLWIASTDTSTWCEDRNAIPGQDHTYRIKADDIWCDEGFSEVSLVGRIGDPPAAPTNPTASYETDCLAVHLDWDPVPDATGYLITRDGEPLADWFTDSFSDSTASTTQEHGYGISATNCGQSGTVELVGRRSAPPVVDALPTRLNPCEGDSVTLNVMADGMGPISYQWYWRERSFDPGQEIVGATSPVLAFEPATETDDGYYECRVSNPCGAVSSGRVEIAVAQPPWILGQPSDVRACAGDDVSLSVDVVSDDAGPTYQWFREGQPLLGETQRSLWIFGVSENDTGLYHVEIFQQCGSVVSESARVSIAPAQDKIVSHPDATASLPGDAAMLGVASAGLPPLDFRWRKDGVSLDRLGANSDTLMLFPFSLEDAGRYDVVVVDSCGWQLSRAVDVDLLEGPWIHAEDGDLLQDAFSQSGSADILFPEALGIRLDMARNISSFPGGNQPGDSMVLAIEPLIPGTVILDPPGGHGGTLRWALLANPEFAAVRQMPPDAGFIDVGARGWEHWEGELLGEIAADIDGPVPHRYAFSLPDDGFFFPGDVLHWHVAAIDDQGNPSTFPRDLSAFGIFEEPSNYDPRFVVRGLPTWDSTLPDGQPPILIWDDDEGSGAREDLRRILWFAGWREGVDYDLYLTRDPLGALGNGLGSGTFHGATLPQLAGYRGIIYCGGGDTHFALSDGTGKDPSDDLDLLTEWHSLPMQRYHAYFGGGLVESLSESMMGPFYASAVLGVGLVDESLFSTAPESAFLIQRPTTTVPCFTAGSSILIDRVLLEGGASPHDDHFLYLEDLEYLEAATPGTVISHEFIDPSGQPYQPALPAALWFDREEEGFRKVSSVHLGRLASQGTDPGGSGGIFGPVELLLEIVDGWGIGGVGSGPTTTPPRSRRAWLAQNTPNPFNPRTSIAFFMPQTGAASLLVYDVAGRRVRMLVHGTLEQGRQQVQWDGRDDAGRQAASGVYLYQLRAGEFVETKRMILLK